MTHIPLQVTVRDFLPETTDYNDIDIIPRMLSFYKQVDMVNVINKI